MSVRCRGASGRRPSRASRTAACSLAAATGTSHHDSKPGTRFSGSVGTTITVIRSAARAWASASRSSSGVSRLEGQRAHRLGVLPEVDRDVRTGQAGCGPVAEAELVAEVRHADQPLEREDALEPVVVEDDDRELEALGDGGDDLGVQHQVRPVADHDDDLAVRRRPAGRPARPRSRSPCTRSRTRRGRPSGRRRRHSRRRSPGRLPAAQITVAWPPTASLTMPMTSAWPRSPGSPLTRPQAR